MNPDGRADALLVDAHLHLQDPALRGMDPAELTNQDIACRIVNGTHPDDWEAVRHLPDQRTTRNLKAFGVHPWKVDSLPDDWEDQLRQYLQAGAVSVGEIGLDHWIEVRDERWQAEVFERQLQIASELNIPPTIHCLKAWGLLVDCLKGGPELGKGFLVHGFGGSTEILHQLADLGGYFSFSAYAADPKRKRMREAARACPPDRLLAETDAPDMVPPESVTRYPLTGKDGKRLHHPREIESAYAFLAGIRGTDADSLSAQIRENFERLFGKIA